MAGLDLICLGDALVDFLPPRRGLRFAEVERFERRSGGASANVAINAARGGLRVGFLGAVGADPFGEFIERALGREGIDTRGLTHLPGQRTRITFVDIDGDGERSFIGFNYASAEQLLDREHIDADWITSARALHFGSNLSMFDGAHAATLHALEVARDAGVLLSCDPNLRPHLWEDTEAMLDRVRAICHGVDVLKLSREELDALGGLDAVRRLEARLLLITDGGGQCRWYLGEEAGVALPPRIEAMDATGAGDAFIAGVITELLRAEADPKTEITPALADRAVERGCQWGARTCERLGAV